MPRHGDNIRTHTLRLADGTSTVVHDTRVDMGVGDDGKRIRLSFRGSSYAAAEKWRRDRLQERDLGLKRVSADRSTVGGWLEHWLQVVVARQYRPPTLECYAGDVRRHILPSPIGRKPLGKLTPADVDAWVTGLLTGAVGRTGKPLAPSTARRCLVVLRKGLNYALRQGYLTRNVAGAAYVERIVVTAPDINVLNLEQLQRLQATVLGTDDEVLYAIELPRGLRVGELLGLRWSDVDFSKREVHVRKQAQKGQITDLKNAASERILALTASEVALLRAQEHRCKLLQIRAGSRWQAQWDMVFPTATGRPRRNSNQHKAWKRLLKRAGLPTSTKFHDLRHSAATLALAHGVPLFDVSRMLGHASVSTTADRYGAWTDQGRQQTAERMASIFGAV
jgi:integrase